MPYHRRHSMPHCFDIPEILFHIFDHVYLAQGHLDLARLALVCKLFSGPALDVLWRVQTSLFPLMTTFPSELLNFARSEQIAVATLTIVRKPTVAQWSRPLLYTKRIRTIMPETTLAKFGGIMVHKSVLQTLIQSCPSKHLFPNIQELCFSTICNTEIVDEATYIKSMFSLNAPKDLRTLSFQYPRGRTAKDARSFLTQFQNHFGTLRSLRVFMDEIPIEITEFLSVFASMQNLECFVMALGPGLCKPKCLSLPNAFVDLRSLGLHSFSTPFVLRLLKAVRASHLQIINLHLASRVSPDELGELFESLTSLAGVHRSIRLISLTTSGYTSALQSIGDLFTLQNLRHLTLHNSGLILDDGKVDEMARAWPSLQHLSILNDVPPSMTVYPTLKCVDSLSQHCPYIGTIELRLNAREVPRRSVSPGPRRGRGAKPAVLGIDLRSDILDSQGVASFLMKTCPGLSVKLIGRFRMQESASWNRVAETINGTLGRQPRVQSPTTRKGPRVIYM